MLSLNIMEAVDPHPRMDARSVRDGQHTTSAEGRLDPQPTKDLKGERQEQSETTLIVVFVFGDYS